MDLPVVSRKRQRDWEKEIDATLCLGFESPPLISKRLCKDLDVCDLEVHEDLEAESFDEELICDVMRSLEQEIQTHTESSSSSSASDDLPNKGFSSVSNNSVEEERGYGIDVEYLLEATDNELGIITPSPSDLQQLSTREDFDNLFDYPEAEIEEESVELLADCEDWMPQHLSVGLFEAPCL